MWESGVDSGSFSHPALSKAINEWRAKISLDKLQKDYRQKGIQVVIPEEPHYPRLLTSLPDFPPLLYYRGTLSGDSPGIAVVGSRKATPYGKAAARYLAQELAKAGIVVISGLARGIDAAAHEGALSVNGVTWAFLGCGVDIVYPRENKVLADKIMASGALVSEFIPGTPPHAPHFPARNRLISGASLGVVVVEAAQKSGALITVDFALEQGREVFAVPGPIFSEMSKGTNQLIKTGAKLVENVDDVLSEIHTLKHVSQELSASPEKDADMRTSLKGRTEVHEQILGQLSDVPVHIDELVKKCTIPVEELALALLELELEGTVEQLPGQCYVLARLGQT